MFVQKFWFSAAMMVCVVSNRAFASLSEDERIAIKKSLRPALMECIKDIDMTEEDFMKMKPEHTGDLDPCLISCFFKKSGIFDSDGKYDSDKATEATKMHIKSEADLAILNGIIKDCIKVNDEEVSDGDKGCERAKLLVECFREHKDQIDLL